MDTEINVMLVFVAFGAVIGFVNGIVELTGLRGFLLALVFFYISYKVVEEVLDLEGTDYAEGAKQILKTGVLPYWFIWLVMWVLVYSLTL